MAKPPPNIPGRGDRCRLRGDHTKCGHLVKYDPESLWATVDWWREAGPGPKVVHLYELEKIQT
jgi:hypothetical protein